MPYIPQDDVPVSKQTSQSFWSYDMYRLFWALQFVSGGGGGGGNVNIVGDSVGLNLEATQIDVRDRLAFIMDMIANFSGVGSVFKTGDFSVFIDSAGDSTFKNGSGQSYLKNIESKVATETTLANVLAQIINVRDRVTEIRVGDNGLEFEVTTNGLSEVFYNLSSAYGSTVNRMLHATVTGVGVAGADSITVNFYGFETSTTPIHTQTIDTTNKVVFINQKPFKRIGVISTSGSNRVVNFQCMR